MIPASVFHFLLYSQLALLLSVSYGNENRDKCPTSFDCGNLGKLHFPFTKEKQQDCGLMAIYGCDDADPTSIKMIELERNGRKFNLTTVLQQENLITVLDEELHKLLESKNCEAFFNNITLPQDSPLISFHIRYNVTLYRCNYSLNVRPPTTFNNFSCPNYEIFYYSLYKHPPNYGQSSFSECSVLQLPKKDLTDSNDFVSFLSGQMVLEVRLSHACDKCYNHEGGQCQLDSNGNFYCNKVAVAEHKVLKLALELGLGLGLFIGLLGILISWWLLGRHCKQKNDSSKGQLQSTNNNGIDSYSSGDPESGRAYFEVPLFSYKELEKATNNFDRSKELGYGSFGTVYYGKLQDGREAAVKHLYDHNYRRIEQFMNEIKILTRLRHQNLVSLYGSTSCHGRELLLVYEYVPNGTVSCHLHGELAHRRLLPWHIRIKIAIETASALAYLHASDTIHRDVKTDNLLLDNNFCVKVADFGLSKLFPSDVNHVSTAPQGTPGYVDPEYHQCYQLTSKSDVYSFGVVLIELISSMAAVDISRNMDEINLANLAIKKIQNREVGELVDPSIGFESNNDIRRMIVSVAELAFQCLQRDKELRPSMIEVLEKLQRMESGKEEHREVLDIHEAGVSHSGPIHPSSPDCDENELLKNIESLPSS